VSEKSISELYYEHVAELERRALAGDEFSIKSLACLALVCEGWRYGDPDPYDPSDGPDGGDKVIEFYKYRLAA
jgi:hypothetical protein